MVGSLTFMEAATTTERSNLNKALKAVGHLLKTAWHQSEVKRQQQGIRSEESPIDQPDEVQEHQGEGSPVRREQN